MKFKYGDLVIGNENASYSITYEGTYWVVIESYSADIGVISLKEWEKSVKENGLHRKLTGYEYYVESDCFDFVRNLVDTSNKAHAPYVLEKCDD